MKILRFITVCAAVFLVAATAGFAQHVRTDFDHQANFGQYKTYSWKEIKPGASLWDSRIKNAVNAQLEAHGLAQVADGGDISIVAIKTSQTQRTLQTFYDGFGGGWRWRGFGDFGEFIKRLFVGQSKLRFLADAAIGVGEEFDQIGD